MHTVPNLPTSDKSNLHKGDSPLLLHKGDSPLLLHKGVPLHFHKGGLPFLLHKGGYHIRDTQPATPSLYALGGRTTHKTHPLNNSHTTNIHSNARGGANSLAWKVRKSSRLVVNSF